MHTHLREIASYLVACWITPEGKVLDFCGDLHHIDFILKNPLKFGLTDEEAKVTTYKEPQEEGITGVISFIDGIKDEDWERIMNKVLENGFIRLRKVRAGMYSFIWYADVHKFDQKAKKILSDWAYNTMGEKQDKDTHDKDTQVKFCTENMVILVSSLPPMGLSWRIPLSLFHGGKLF